MGRELIKFDYNGGHLVGSWGIPTNARSGFPLVVLATGDGPNGSEGQTWTQLVPILLHRGIGTFLFDFAGLGHSPGVYDDLTLTSGCRDFRAAMEFVTLSGNHNMDRVGVIGSSFGGNVALLEAANFPQVKAIGLKSASTFLPEGYQIEYGAKLMEDWGREGYSEKVGHKYTIVLDSLFHNTYEAASRIDAKVRIVHGTADTSVPIRHARDLLRVLKHGSIFEIEGADHWYAEGDEWQRMASNLVDFMSDEL
ncbi:MAG: alpha/beta hydrolase [Actinomycetota bacterium]